MNNIEEKNTSSNCNDTRIQHITCIRVVTSVWALGVVGDPTVIIKSSSLELF